MEKDSKIVIGMVVLLLVAIFVYDAGMTGAWFFGRRTSRISRQPSFRSVAPTDAYRTGRCGDGKCDANLSYGFKAPNNLVAKDPVTGKTVKLKKVNSDSSVEMNVSGVIGKFVRGQYKRVNGVDLECLYVRYKGINSIDNYVIFSMGETLRSCPLDCSVSKPRIFSFWRR